MLIHAKLYGVPRRTARRADRRPAGIGRSAEISRTRWCAHFPAACAGGWKSRAAWFTRRKILFLDEPTTGLDPVSRTNVWEMIRNLREKSELTILLTTHYMDEADKLCDRIAIVDHGKLAALDTPTRLKDSVPGTDIVEAEFENAPPDWDRQLRGLAQAAGVTQRDGLVHISIARRPGHRRRADGSGAGARK